MKSIKLLGLIGLLLAGWTLGGCSPTPAELKVGKEKYVLDGMDAQDKIEITVFDEKGAPVTEGVELVYFTTDFKVVKLNQQTGEIKAVSSGEADIEVELVGTDLKINVPVRVKIAGSINLSHEKLRLWTGQVKENVWSEIHSEKGAWVEGFVPEWASEDPSIVKVEQINDPNRRQSWVKLTGMKSGNTFIMTTFRHLTKSIRVRVYDEDEEVSLAGERIGKAKKEEAEKKSDKKKWKKIKK